MASNDLRRALRSSRQHPARAALAVLIFALAIGVNSAIFSLVNAVLIRPLSFDDPDRLVTVWTEFTQQGRLKGKLSQPELADLRESGAFSGLAGFTTQTANLTGSGEPRQVVVALVTPDLPIVLGLRPEIGRGFPLDELHPGQIGGSVLLTRGFWQRQFGADREVVGRSLVLDGVPYEIAGVLPRHDRFLDEVEIWVPYAVGTPDPTTRGAHFLEAIGRIATDPVSAQTEVDALAARLQREHPRFYPPASGWGLRLIPLREETVGAIRPALLLLLGAGGLVLLIACGNLANLWLIHVWGKRKDLAVQVALGATRGRIVRQLLTESVTLAVAGGVVGLALARASLRPALTAVPVDVIRDAHVPLDLNVVAFSLTLSLLLGALVGLVPALRVTRGLAATLKEESAKTSRSRGSRRVRQALVMAEMALALLVVISATLLVKNLSGLYRVDPGFEPERVLTVSLSLPTTKYSTGGQIAAFYRELLPRVRSIPGVESASAVSLLPLSGQDYSGDFTVEGMPYDPATGTNEASRRAVGPGYFETMEIPLLAGSDFTERDLAPDAPGAVIVDAALAQRLWPDRDPLGSRLKLGKPDLDNPWLTVRGVVGHVEHDGLDSESRPQMYLPLPQLPRSAMSLVLRTTSDDPSAVAGAVRAEIREIDPSQPVSQVRTMEDWMASSLSRQRFATLLLASFALLGLVLAGVGVFVVMASSTAERTREIAIRMALGALPRNVLDLVLRQSLTPTLLGLGLGLAASLPLTPILASQLHELSPLDPSTYVASVTLLTVTALLATYLPARRASRKTPGAALNSP